MLALATPEAVLPQGRGAQDAQLQRKLHTPAPANLS